VWPKMRKRFRYVEALERSTKIRPRFNVVTAQWYPRHNDVTSVTASLIRNSSFVLPIVSPMPAADSRARVFLSVE
jgi:hypothetical protein